MNINLDNIDLSELNWESFTVDQKLELINLLEEREIYKKYNKVESFIPYDFQKQFYAASKQYKRRFLCAANRIGKTYSAAAEVAYHATGLYPSWWEGHKFIKKEMVTADGRPNPHDLIIWCVGITGDSTRKVLQKEIFGTEMAKDVDALGTGSIPRSCIDMEKVERDGNIIRVAKVKHYDPDGHFDGYTTLEFRSTQQGKTFALYKLL